jgi:tryptophan synthase beta chain
MRQAPAHPGAIFVVNLSGRGDKDIDIYRENIPEMDPDREESSK